MKLSNVQVKDVLNQMDTQVIPADHPAIPQLERTFGAHTFFLGKEGLHVVERGEAKAPTADNAYAVKVASWSDEQKTSLVPHPGEIAKIVDIGPESADPGSPNADQPTDPTVKTAD